MCLEFVTSIYDLTGLHLSQVDWLPCMHGMVWPVYISFWLTGYPVCMVWPVYISVWSTGYPVCMVWPVYMSVWLTGYPVSIIWLVYISVWLVSHVWFDQFTSQSGWLVTQYLLFDQLTPVWSTGYPVCMVWLVYISVWLPSMYGLTGLHLSLVD